MPTAFRWITLPWRAIMVTPPAILPPSTRLCMNLDNSSTLVEETPTSSGLAVGKSWPREGQVEISVNRQNAQPSQLSRSAVKVMFSSSLGECRLSGQPVVVPCPSVFERVFQISGSPPSKGPSLIAVRSQTPQTRVAMSSCHSALRPPGARAKGLAVSHSELDGAACHPPSICSPVCTPFCGRAAVCHP